MSGKNNSNINPWMNEHEREVNEIKDKIEQALSRRNHSRNIDTLEGKNEMIEVRREITNERKKYKEYCKKWDGEWWKELAEKCERYGN